jgi:DNA-binding response OmpR family regulator
MLTVMIAEDDMMIANAVEETLAENGYAVCGIARTVAEGVEIGRRCRPDLAILDMRLLDGGRGTEIADELKTLAPLGVLFASGSREDQMSAGFRGEAFITKPYRDEALLRALEIVAGLMAGKNAAPPFPKGFHLLPEAGRR